MPSRTLGLIKPDAFEKRIVGQIISRIELRGQLRIVAAKTERLTEKRTAEFYAEHNTKSTFDRLCRFMSSGPILIMCLESNDDNA